ncbi:hypothetical protein, partial [Metabacillus lacus]|uniref:hypothetical protein n=1 Tax=Metabacillus lacus TaxID=1983721 RepID=UPI001BA52BB7
MNELVISSSIRSLTLSCTEWNEIGVEIPLIREKQLKSAEIEGGIKHDLLVTARNENWFDSCATKELYL